MNLNKIIKPKINDLPDKPICLRGRLNTGTTCNLNCEFCYYQGNLKDPFRKLSIIENEINLLKASGMTSIDLSGGESSIHPEFLTILDMCKNFDKIAMLTNGISFSDIDKLKEAKDHGLSEILFSLHGWNTKSHNEKVDHKAFRKIIQAIKNAQELDMDIRINCTVQNDFDGRNYARIIKYLIRCGVKIQQLNFLPLNRWESSHKLDYLDYQKVSPKIMIFIDKDIVPVTVRYIPFCFMKGYEKYCVSTLDHIYDLTDWNIQTFDLTTVQDITVESMLETAITNRIASYDKPRSCKDCEFILRCDGYEK
jgi:MoaA/NifB/PqqE/SkfB family radical SAM enzyme